MSPREAVATFLGEDFADMKDREYQPGRHGGTVVYTSGERYLIALPNDRAPSKAIREAFPGCAIDKAAGDTADFIRTQGKTVWIIAQAAK